MVGKLHKSWPGGHVYMQFAVDKFTKWIEAAPVTTQDSTVAINFIKSILFCFGVPHSIITDNVKILHPRNSKTTAKGWASSLTLPLLRTRRRTDKLKRPTG
jgi:transposase-like protein